MNKKTTSIFFIFFLLIICPFEANAQSNIDATFAYEGFDYQNTSSIPMHNGSNYVNGSGIIYWKHANGWINDWVVADKTTGLSNKIIPGYNIIMSPIATDYVAGLKTLISSGHYAQGGFLGGNTYAGRKLQTSTGGPFANNINTGGAFPYQGLITNTHPSITGKVGKDGATLWLGLILQKVNNDNDSVFVTLHNNPNVYNPYGGKTISIGYFGAATCNFGGNRYWGVRINNTVYTNFASANTKIDITKPALLVLKIVFDKVLGNSISFRANPPVIGAGFGSEPPADITPPTITGDFSFTSMAYYGGGFAGASIIDEIRFAGSYKYATQSSDVVSIVSGLCTGSLGDNAYPQGTFGYPGDDEFGAGTAGPLPTGGSGDDLANSSCGIPMGNWCSPYKVYFRKDKAPWNNFTNGNYTFRGDLALFTGAGDPSFLQTLEDNEYTIVSEIRNKSNFSSTNCGTIPSWITSNAPSGKPNDYLMMINGSYKPLTFYEQIVPNLCSGIKY